MTTHLATQQGVRRIVNAIVALLVFGLLAGAGEQRAWAESGKPVGVVASLKGEVTVQRGEKLTPLRLYSMVYEGDRLTVSEGGAVGLAFHADGHVESRSVVGSTLVRKDGLSPAGDVIVASKSRRGNAVQLAVAQLPESSVGGVRAFRSASGEGQESPLVEPIYGATVCESRPVFRWQPVADVNSYRLEIRAATQPVWTAVVEEPVVRYEGSELIPDVVYEWQVIGQTATGERRLVIANFELASKEHLAALDSWRQMTRNAEPTVLSIAARQLKAQGMFAEAILLYEAIVKQEPENASFHAALGQLYSIAGRQDEADAELKTARQLGLDVASVEF